MSQILTQEQALAVARGFAALSAVGGRPARIAFPGVDVQIRVRCASDGKITVFKINGYHTTIAIRKYPSLERFIELHQEAA